MQKLKAHKKEAQKETQTKPNEDSQSLEHQNSAEDTAALPRTASTDDGATDSGAIDSGAIDGIPETGDVVRLHSMRKQKDQCWNMQATVLSVSQKASKARVRLVEGPSENEVKTFPFTQMDIVRRYEVDASGGGDDAHEQQNTGRDDLWNVGKQNTGGDEPQSKRQKEDEHSEAVASDSKPTDATGAAGAAAGASDSKDNASRASEMFGQDVEELQSFGSTKLGEEL